VVLYRNPDRARALAAELPEQHSVEVADLASVAISNVMQDKVESRRRRRFAGCGRHHVETQIRLHARHRGRRKAGRNRHRYGLLRLANTLVDLFDEDERMAEAVEMHRAL
jgi:hypothetical protein